MDPQNTLPNWPSQITPPYVIFIFGIILTLISILATNCFNNNRFNAQKENIRQQSLIDFMVNNNLDAKGKQNACLILEEIIHNTNYFKDTAVANKVLRTACQKSYQDSTILTGANVVVGLVLDNETKKPIKDATVSFGDELVYTDGRGLFGFSIQKNKSENKYIWTRKAGYEADQKEVSNLNKVSRMKIYLESN